MEDIRRHNLELLIAETGGKKVDLARKIKKSAVQISQWLSGFRTISEDSARAIESALRKPTYWMDSLHAALDASTPTDSGAPTRAMAQVLSLAAQRVAPTLTWEQLTMKPTELPAEFHVVLQDDAMAPRAPAGVKVKLDSTRTPRPGDAVLVQRGDDPPYFREYRVHLGGTWEAHATNPAYPSLRSDQHPLVVLAVFVGIDTPWAALAR